MPTLSYGEDGDREGGEEKEEAAYRKESNPTLTWKEYLPEKSRRIHKWWQNHRDQQYLKSFVYAERLIVLCQVSSAAIERVFSLYLRIREKLGMATLMDNVNVRAKLMHLSEHAYSKTT